MRYRYLIVVFALLLLMACDSDADKINNDDVVELHNWLDLERTTPADLLAFEIAQGRSVVLLQEDIFRSDTTELMYSLVPTLYDLGIKKIGVYFLASSDQDNIERYIELGAAYINPQDLLFSANATLGYFEYLQFIQYVHDFNVQNFGKSDGIQLVGLSDSGSTSVDRVLSMLNPKESLDGDSEESAESEPVFLWLTAKDLDSLMSSLDSEPTIPAFVTHHGPVNGNLVWNGLIESVVRDRPLRDRTFAYKPESSPFNKWHDGNDLTRTDIVMVTAFPYRAVKAIPNFVKAETVEASLEFFENFRIVKPRKSAAARMNGIIRRRSRRYAREIKNLVPEGS